MAKPKRIVYDNGAELFYLRCKANRATKLVVGIKTGSYDNGKEQGLAHFFEHMMFKGTDVYSVNDIKKIWGQKIRSFNAYTGSKEVAFHFYESDKRLEEGMKLVSNLLFESTFPKEELEKEKGVIKQEYFQTLDKNSRVLESRLVTVMFDNKLVMDNIESSLGTPEKIDSYSQKDFLSFQKKNVCSNNLVISASGPLSFLKFKKLAEEYFVNKAKSNPKLKTFNEDNLVIKGKPSLFVIKKGIEKTNYLILIKNAVTYGNKRTDIIVGLIYSILSAVDGKLFRKLRDERGLVYHASTYGKRTKINGSFGFSVETTKDKVNESLDVLKEVAEEYIKEGIDDKSFEALVENRLLDDDKNIKTPEYAPFRMIGDWRDYGKFTKKGEYRKILKAITIEEVNDTMNKLFCQTNDVYFGAIGNIEEKDIYPYKKIRKMFDFRKYAKKDKEEEKDEKDEKDEDVKLEQDTETNKDNK